MKFRQLTNLNWLLSALIVFGFASCKKLNSEGFTPGIGAPVITSVRTLSKSTVDSSRVHSTTTYSSSGIVTTTSYFDYTPVVSAFDSTTATGKLGNYYVLLGSNLGSTTTIVINGVSIYFNRALSSDKAVIFSIPTTVPYVQPQPNTIVVTTLHGSVTYKFTTLPPPPTITEVSDFDFWANAQISIVGKGFASVSAVKVKTTGDAMTILSQTDTTMVLKAPSSSTATESALLFTFTSGANSAATATSSVIFNDLDNAYTIVFNNSFQNSWGDNSWSGPSGIQPGNAHAFGGTASASAHYPAGAWQIEGWANYYPSIPYDASYKYLTFWVKGGTVTHQLVLVGDKMAGGYGQVQNANAYAGQLVTVPAKVWTFVKIPLTAPATAFDKASTLLNYWANGSPAQQMGFFLQGMSGDVDETMYFDEVAFLK